MGLDDGYKASFDFSTLLGKTVDVIFVLKKKEKKKIFAFSLFNMFKKPSFRLCSIVASFEMCWLTPALIIVTVFQGHLDCLQVKLQVVVFLPPPSMHNINNKKVYGHGYVHTNYNTHKVIQKQHFYMS